MLKRSLLTAIGNVRAGFDGAQDYDVVLRASEQAAKIVHVPQVLYHWRMHAQSTASNKASKGYAFDNGKRALAEHLTRPRHRRRRPRRADASACTRSSTTCAPSRS